MVNLLAASVLSAVMMTTSGPTKHDPTMGTPSWYIVVVAEKHCWYPITGNGPTPNWVLRYGSHCPISVIDAVNTQHPCGINGKPPVNGYCHS